MQSVSDMPFVAGHAALDFLNTAEERGHPDAVDALGNAHDLRVWGRRYGLLARSASLDRRSADEFKKAREARELLYALFFARAHNRPLPRSALARVADLASDAYRAASLKTRGDGSIRWQWDRSDLATVRHIAVTSAVELLQTASTSRLKQCPGDHCGWFFIDTTRRGNRRWCSMSECGQEAKNLGRRKATRARARH